MGQTAPGWLAMSAQLTGMRPTANQEAPRAQCYSRCSNGIPGFRPASIAPLTRWTVLSQLRRLPRRWISVLERDPSLRGRKGPAGCHHSRFNLQQTANQSKSVNCSDMVILTVISRAVAGGAAGVSAIAPTQNRSRPRSTSNRADCPAPSSQSLASRHGKYRRCSHKRLWRS